MPYQLTAPLVKTYKLLRSDPSGDTTVTFRQATRGDQDRRQDLTAEATRIWNDAEQGEIQLKQRISMAEIHRMEVNLTMVECNILNEAVDGEDPKPLFRFKTNSKGRSYLDMSESAFAMAWAKLPDDIADEIHEKAVEHNPQWGKADKSE